MNKNIDIKKVAQDFINEHGPSGCKLLIAELQKLLELNSVKIFYSGTLDDHKKKILQNWLSNHVKGSTEVQYIQDEKLISGLKITYRDYDYEDNLVSELKNLSWKN